MYTKGHKEFEKHIAAIEIVITYIERSLSLLQRSVEGQLPLTNKKDVDIMRLALTHYIVNNLRSLFDDRDRNVNSLPNLVKHFGTYFPTNFFLEFKDSISNFRVKYSGDLKRIEKNRHLSTAHLGSGKGENLGWKPEVAKNIDELLGTESSIAINPSLLFVTPYSILEMPIIKSIAKLKNIVESLQIKFITKFRLDA